ncbi:hypothetical protein [Demequina gelatinilytica]|uniref:hypothetical protein n=1 Tax=Demequina gelatinilytica TaxID=1638980 RepID=UPI0007837205|nr:hypothetical protein [Demequina gelatinilytica]
MTATLTPRDLKRAGQQASVYHLDSREAREAATEAIVTALPAGMVVSVNVIRPELDAANIPNRSRGGLMVIMCSRGHLEPIWTTFRGLDVPVTEPSTGPSAHSAPVRVYIRTAHLPEGS